MNRERIMFRLLQMPCCGIMLCWANPRLPNYCPECGKRTRMSNAHPTEAVIFQDDEAWLSHKEIK